jgi:hypothetical protein
VSRLLGDIGTIEWCRAGNGLLGRGERARFMAAVVLKTMGSLPRLLAARLGLRGAGPDPSAITPPDSAVTRHVLAACSDLDPMLVQHGYRSFLFARALGTVERISCDPEALFVAAILHDHAFQAMDAIGDRCFALAGAEVAARLLAETSLAPALQHDVLDGITLHLNPTVGPERGALQHLLHDGILLDVVGARSWHLDGDGIRRVVERHPRHQFNRRGEPILRAHARRVPGARSRALFACGFSAALRLGPWPAREGRAEPERAPPPAA